MIKNTVANSGLAQLGFGVFGEVGFVLGSSVFKLYIWLTKSPTDAKPRDVTSKPTATDVLDIKNKNHIQKLPKFANKDFN